MSQAEIFESVLKMKNRQGLLGSMRDEDAIKKEIEEKLPPEQLRTFDVKPLFHLVEDILNLAIQNVNSSVMDTRAYMEDKTHQEEVIRMREKFTYKMDQISYKIAYNTSSGVDPHNTLISIFKILSGYSWEAKLILTLSAFALNYGECWHLALIYSSNQLAKSMSILKQVADIRKQSGLSAPPLEAVNDLVRAMMDVTRCIIEFQELGTQLDDPKKLEPYNVGSDQIPLAIYWTIRGVLASASQITSLTSMGFNYVISSTEKEELIALTDKLNKKRLEIKDQQEKCYPTLEEAKMIKRRNIIKSLMEVPQVDNMSILRALIYYKDDQQPLVDGSNRKVDLDVLRKKMVLLLISDLDIPLEDIDIVKQMYSKSRDHKTNPESRFEIVWLPIVDPPVPWEMIQAKFEKVQRAMPWYTVHRPSLIAKEVIKLTKEEWHFEKQPIIVVIDAQGQVACPNALPMMWIWGNEAYPFTTGAEEALWKENAWNLELLVDGIYPPIIEAMRHGKCICLYGGEDMEWIKMFTTRAPSVAEAARTSLEMVYVGKSEPSEQVQRHTSTISREKLSKYLPKEGQWRFWSRIVNMGHSRMQLGKTIQEDPIMQDIVSLLNLDASGTGWAVFFRGSDLIIKAKGKQILHSLINFIEWKDCLRWKDFISALDDHVRMKPEHTDVLKHIESYERTINRFERNHHVDSMRVVKALISAEDYWQPLVDGATKKRVNLDLLRKKEFLLLISDLNILQEELDWLAQIYEDLHKNPTKPESQREIIWLPIIETGRMQTENAQMQFAHLQSNMPWYTLYHPSIIDQPAIRFIKEVWHYEDKTILVALDQQGRVTCPNALHMMWVWGTTAFPFTTKREEDLWKNESWGIKFLVDGIDRSILNWILEDKLICLYGGVDIEWIRQFTGTAREVAQAANIPMEMVYVGRSNPKKRVQRIIRKIISDKLSACWEDLTVMWFFWYRLESMWYSRYQLGRTIKDDYIMQELTMMLGFDRSEGGWAIMSKGFEPGEMVKAKGSDFLDCLLNFRDWKKNALEKGFLPTLKEKLKKAQTYKPVYDQKTMDCYQLVLPDLADTILEGAGSSICQRTKESFITFKCCG